MKLLLIFCMLLISTSSLGDCNDYGVDSLYEKVDSRLTRLGDIYFTLGFLNIKNNRDIRSNEMGIKWLDCAVENKNIFASAFLGVLYYLVEDKKKASSYFGNYGRPELFNSDEFEFANAYGGALPLHTETTEQVNPQLSKWLNGDPLNYKELAKWLHYGLFVGDRVDLSATSYRSFYRLEKCRKFKPAFGMSDRLIGLMSYDAQQAAKSYIQTLGTDLAWCNK